MKIYIAALFSMQNVAAEHRTVLEAQGHTVTASWIDVVEADTAATSSHAHQDLHDVDAADAIVLVTLPKGTEYKGGGRHFEFGYAYSRGKKCFVLGEREHVFCHLDDVVVCGDVEELVNKLSREGF